MLSPLGWPREKPEFLVKSLNTQDRLLAQGEIAHIDLLGSGETVDWRHGAEGLKINLPVRRPCDFACVFKILLK